LFIQIAETVLGWLFVVLGLLGLFLPLLQGILFLVIGLTLLSARYAFARRLLDKARQRYPAEYGKVEETYDRIMANKPLLATAMVVLAGLLALGIYLLVLGVRQLMAMT
jgi:uncharacterized membrane protein YbaN (DUF454 family)